MGTAMAPGIAHRPSLTLLLLSFLVIAPPPWTNFAHAQNTSRGGAGSDNASPPPPYFNPKFNPSMAILIVILITAFFFMGFFSIYLRNCGSSSGDGGSGTGRIPNGAVGAAARSRRALNRGLDPAIIATIPTLVYSDVKEHKLGKGSLECAVCLSEFDDEEELRLLPNCSHAFHTDCIDTWLASHTTCPVCRDNLAATTPASAADADVTAVTGAATTGDAAVTNEEQALPPPVDGEGSVGSRSRRDQERQVEYVVVDIPAPPTSAEESGTAPLSPYLSSSTSQKRSGSVRGGFSGSLRGGSLRGGTVAGGLLRSWRSRSARPAVWAEDDRERFTLRLPEYVRREVISGKLNRSRSLASFPVACPPVGAAAGSVSGISEGGSRRGYRSGLGGEGSSRGGGWRSGRFGWTTKSDRWASFARQLSFRFGLGGNGNGNGSAEATEGSIAPGKPDAAEGSVSSRGKPAGNAEKKAADVGKP